MKPWPGLAPYSRRVSTATCGEIFCFDSGEPREPSRRAFVLVHGLGDEADTWRHVFPLIARQARVLALDLPGFGRSLARRRATLGSSARALLEFLDATAPGEVVLVGSSMGAVVSQLAEARERRLASRERRGSRIRALCLVDGGLPGLQAAPGTWSSILPILGERGYTYLSTRPDRAYASLRLYYGDLDALSAADRDFLRSRVAARVTSAAQKRAYFSLLRDLGLWVAFRSLFFARELETFTGPVLVAWGEKDRLDLPGAAATLLRLARGSEGIVLEGSGHLPQQERPEALAAAILDWAAEAKQEG
jgi:pimeloyl-ACP methyl ester carboxylesterase